MNAEIRTKAAQFLFWEFFSSNLRFFVFAVQRITRHKRSKGSKSKQRFCEKIKTTSFGRFPTPLHLVVANPERVYKTKLEGETKL
jgi:hypothetical protein